MTEPDTTVHEVHEKAHPSVWEYVKIALVLAFLTAAEVAVSYLDMNHTLQIFLLLSMMVLKFALVVLWFMHVKFDSPGYGRAFVFGIALAATVYGAVLLMFGVFQK
jgi:cytochrome c oxidase subunit 4